MNLPKLEDLVGSLRYRIRDKARQAVAVQMAVDVAQLQVRAVRGENVELEVRAARDRAAALDASEAGTVIDAVMTWLVSVGGDVARGVLKPVPEWEDRGRRGGAPPARSSD
jgi:hypothetical protein